jgi:ribosomal protein L15
MKCRESWKKERYFFKGKTYANIIFRGKTLCVCLAIDPKSLEGTKYFYEDVSATKKYESIPVMVRVRSGRGCKYALELIKMMFDAAGIEQKRDISDSFTYRTATKDELIEMGFIKVMMTDGDGEAVAADFNAMKTLDFSAGMPILKKVSVEEVAVVPDEEVAQFIETETDENNTGSGRRKGIVNIDSISAAYNAGDVVNLKSLKEKKLIAKNIDFVKVLARGTIDKSLTVKADDFSMDAVKMIIITGGTVIKLKKKA